MLNIELPMIDGRELAHRWNIYITDNPRAYAKLHYCIFELGLSVYNFDGELQEGIVDEEIVFNDNGEPISYHDKRNNLYFFDTFVKRPEKFYPEETFHSHAFRNIRRKDRTYHRANIYDILESMFFKTEDVKRFEQKYRDKKYDLPDHIDETSEFLIYDSIVNGKLRPFLEIYSSEDYIKDLIKKLWCVSFVKTEDGWRPSSKSDKSLLEISAKTGDILKIELDETDPEKAGTLTNITNDILGELIDIDIPPPPDLKAEYFLDLITIEYEKIKLRANKALKTLLNEEQISLFVNKNIQILKEIAGQAHTLYRGIKPREKRTDPWDDPDSYIIYILKTYLIRSICFYQELFQPYLKVPMQDEFQLRSFLYGERSFEDFSRDFEKRSINLIYKKLRNEIETLKKRDDKNSDHTIAALKF